MHQLGYCTLRDKEVHCANISAVKEGQVVHTFDLFAHCQAVIQDDPKAFVGGITTDSSLFIVNLSVSVQFILRRCGYKKLWFSSLFFSSSCSLSSMILYLMYSQKWYAEHYSGLHQKSHATECDTHKYDTKYYNT